MWFIFAATTPAHQQLFHAGWFIESLMTQTLVVHVIRTNKVPFIESMPSKRLIALTLGVVLLGLIIVATPIRSFFGFEELPLSFYPILFAMVLAYLLLTQFAKSEMLKRKWI